MQRCQCVTSKGNQCSRDASNQSGLDQQLCWQHQKCQKTIAIGTKQQKKTIPKKKVTEPTAKQETKEPSPQKEVNEATPKKEAKEVTPKNEIKEPTPKKEVKEPSPKKEVKEPLPKKETKKQLDLNWRLIKAVRGGQLKRVESALKQGADVHYDNGVSLWFAAGYQHNIEIVRKLLEYGADANKLILFAIPYADGNKYYVFGNKYAMYMGGGGAFTTTEEISNLLKNTGTKLIYVGSYEEIEQYRNQLESGKEPTPKIKKPTPKKETLTQSKLNSDMLSAVEFDHPIKLAEFLKKGADVHHRNDLALYIAARKAYNHEKTAVLKTLLNFGANAKTLIIFVHPQKYSSQIQYTVYSPHVGKIDNRTNQTAADLLIKSGAKVIEFKSFEEMQEYVKLLTKV